MYTNFARIGSLKCLLCMYNFFQYYNKYIDFSALGCAKDARASKSDRQKNDKFVVTTMQVAT